VKARPDFAQAWANLGLAQHHLAVEADSDDRLLARAEESFLKETQLRPDGAWGWFNLGTARLARSRITEAEAAFRKAIALAPAHAEALNNLGCVLDLTIDNRPGDPLAALHCYQDALVVDPDYADAHRNIATWYFTTPGHIDHELALHHWRTFYRLSANDPAAQDEARVAIAAIKKAQFDAAGKPAPK
jgi:tetratricopeptide (TPR) repeat protein